MIRVLHGFAEEEPMHGLLGDHGFAAIHRPFFSHEIIVSSLPFVVPEVILISSARTIRYWGDWGEYIQKNNIPVLAIASKTQDALRRVGIEAILGGGSGSTLVAALDELPYRSFTHVGAQSISSTLAKAFEEQNRPYQRVAVYRSIAAIGLEEYSHCIDVGCLNSERCAELWAQGLSEIPVVCLGGTTEKRAEALGLNVLGVATEPHRDKLVHKLVELRAQGMLWERKKSLL